MLILPILNIYRKLYGIKMMFVVLGTFYVAMVCAGYLVELQHDPSDYRLAMA
ncbi:MAG: hypothetical protein NVS4B6_15960 [Mycobacterium sp.]